MELIGSILSGCMSIFSLPIDLFGFSVSLWQIFLVSAILTIIGRLIWGIFA